MTNRKQWLSLCWQHSLQESRLVFGLIVVAELDLTLIASKLAGFIKGDRMGAIQNVISSLSTHTQIR